MFSYLFSVLSQHYEDNFRLIWTSYEYIFWLLSKVTPPQHAWEGLPWESVYYYCLPNYLHFPLLPSQNHINDKDSKFIGRIDYCIIALVVSFPKGQVKKAVINNKNNFQWIISYVYCIICTHKSVFQYKNVTSYV